MESFIQTPGEDWRLTDAVILDWLCLGTVHVLRKGQLMQASLSRGLALSTLELKIWFWDSSSDYSQMFGPLFLELALPAPLSPGVFM